jgi:hypothetical protein
MIRFDFKIPCDEKQPGHTRGEDYAVCNGNPNKFKATGRKEYLAEGGEDDNYQTGQNLRMPL